MDKYLALDLRVFVVRNQLESHGEVTCANVETLSVSSTFAYFNVIIGRRMRMQLIKHTIHAVGCCGPLPPKLQSSGQYRLLSWHTSGGKMLILPKAPNEWRKGGLQTEVHFILRREVNVVHWTGELSCTYISDELIIQQFQYLFSYLSVYPNYLCDVRSGRACSFPMMFL